MRRLSTIGIVCGLIVIATWLLWRWQARFFSHTPQGSSQAVPNMEKSFIDRVGWIASPGPLSMAHAALSESCAGCHTPFRRVPDSKCVNCHVKNTDLLTRKATAFHARATRCISCHTEHQGMRARIARMEHAVLDPGVGCAECHFDKHQEFFGTECAECHSVTSWRVAGYRHPSPRSQDCAQCHKGPPSHYMMHFQMVDQAFTGIKDATVEQCWRCHTTDHWNNIKGIGYYKHH